jgi:hypothetical protein
LVALVLASTLNRGWLMRTGFFAALAAVAVLAGCSRTENGDIIVKRPSGVDVKTTTDTLQVPSVTTRTDTINAPVIGTRKDTIIVNKPVFGSEKKVVKVPTVQKP